MLLNTKKPCTKYYMELFITSVCSIKKLPKAYLLWLSKWTIDKKKRTLKKQENNCRLHSQQVRQRELFFILLLVRQAHPTIVFVHDQLTNKDRMDSSSTYTVVITVLYQALFINNNIIFPTWSENIHPLIVSGKKMSFVIAVSQKRISWTWRNQIPFLWTLSCLK